MLSTYLSYQLIARDMPASLSHVETQPMVQRETDYYLENIGKVTSIDDFVNDDRLFRYAMKAYGLEDMAYAKAFMVKALKEGISDPDSFANKLTDKRYHDFVEAFNFEKYGALATSFNAAQDAVPQNFVLRAQVGVTQEGFDFDRAETDYYLANISDVTSIDDLMADDRLLAYAMAAFGLDADTESPQLVRRMLEDGVSDPTSLANMMTDKRYAAFVSAFDFAQYGDQTTSREAVRQAVPLGYMAGTGLALVRPSDEYVEAETDYYLANIENVTSIDDLMADDRLLGFAMAAYGLDAETEDPQRIRQMLEGGVSDPDSPANLEDDKRYAAFVSAFDFAQYGDQTTSRDEVLTGTPSLYDIKSAAGLVKPGAGYVQAETAYYQANVSKLESIDDLMADRRLLDYALYSFGLDPATETPEHIRALLEGGIDDPESLANVSGDKRYVDFVSSFNFARYGEKATTVNPAQQSTVDMFLRQTLEEDQGEQNEGVRLALYFQRKAPELTSYYEILADPALAETVRTALGFPAAIAQADVDKQVDMMKERFDLADFQDPEKLGDFLQRFTSLWDVSNPTESPAQASIAALFSKPAEFGVSTDLLLTLAQLRR